MLYTVEETKLADFFPETAARDLPQVSLEGNNWNTTYSGKTNWQKFMKKIINLSDFWTYPHSSKED
jgi:hypothetical protein